MAGRTQLIQQLERARQELWAALDEIDPAMEICPGWTSKEMLAHIAGWDRVTVPSLRAHADGIEPGAPAAGDIDLVNAQLVETYRALSYSQMVSEFERVREQFKTALQEMTEQKLAEPFLYPWGERGTIADLVAILAGHEEEHAREIQHLTAGKA
jgi:hypothetical protein